MRRESKAKSVLLLALLGVATGAAASTPLAGLSVEEAIAELERRGLKVYYSSDLVRPTMRVGREPIADEPVTVLTEILEPLGLMLRRGLNDAWLIVRTPGAHPADTAPASEPEQRATRALYLPSEQRMEEIVVTASQYEIRRSETASQRLITEWELEYLPSIGEDAIRAVARLPGMASNGLSAIANVRGGEISETLVRLDGLRLYDPFHLRHFQNVFSAIDPRVVRSMEIYTGGFPAVYGDRMSGVIDVETLPAPADRYHEIGFSFFNSSLLSSGGFADQRGEWLASIRRSNLDILYDRFSEQPERPHYTDVFAKIGFEVSDKLRITGNLLRAEDDVSLSDDIDREERASATQLDTYTWLRFDQLLGARTSGSTLVSRSELAGVRTGSSDKAGISAGSLTDRRSFTIERVQSDWHRLTGARSSLGFGAIVTRARGQYDYNDSVVYDLLFDYEGAPASTSRSRRISASPQARQYEIYATLRTDWTSRLTSEVGLRWNRQRVGSERNSTAGPRLGLRYALSRRTTLRASWGRYYQSQAIHELQISDGVTSFTPPQRSDHIVIGLDRQLGNDVQLRIEAYDKSMSDLRPRFENLLNSRVLLPELKPDRIRIAPTSGRARGLEATFDGQIGRVRWWAAVSRARVEDRIGLGNVLRSWDQTDALSTGLSWDTPRWNVSGGIVYRSGWPTTPVTLDADATFPTVTVIGRNLSRMSPYGSLDMRISRKFEFEASSLTLSLELANVSNRGNPCCVEYEIGDEEDAGLLVLDEVSYLPTIPSIGILWKF